MRPWIKGVYALGRYLLLLAGMVGMPCVRVVAALEPAETLPASEAVWAAMEFRMAAGRNAGEAVKRFRVSPVLPLIVRGDPSRTRSDIWSSFFGNCMVFLGHVESPRVVIGYYHALYDAVLVTLWECKENGPEMVGADLRMASRMESGGRWAVPIRPVWLEESRNRPAPEALKRSYEAFVEAFEKTYPARSSAIPVLELSARAETVAEFVEAHALAAIRSVLAIQREKDGRYLKTLKDLRDALGSGNRRALLAMVPSDSATRVDALLELPATQWRNFVPVHAALSLTDSMVFLQDTRFPNSFLLVLFKHGGVWNRPDVASAFFFGLGVDSKR